MTKETHSKGGYLISLLLLPYIYKTFLMYYNLSYRIVLLFIYAYFTHLGALISDIDMKGSYISKRFIILHKLFGKRFKHRGFTHSLLFVGILAFAGDTIYLSSNNNVVFACIFSGFLAGVISHIILDLLTKEGVELFYPLGINFSLLPIKTSSKAEKNFSKILSIAVIFLIGYRFYLITL
ncbi:metal-dependent hydrolase [Terrisporobacter sp.]